MSVANPGILRRGGGAGEAPQEGGSALLGKIFAKNCMRMKEIEPRMEWRVLGAPWFRNECVTEILGTITLHGVFYP